MRRIILIIAFSLSCNVLFSQNNLENEFFKQHFTKAERAGLGKIISFVDSLVQLKSNNADINTSYHNFLDTIREHEGDFAFNEEFKYSFLFNLDSSLFNKIWIKNTTHRKIKTKDTTLVYPENFITIYLNAQGEYVKLLKDLGDSSNYFKLLYESIIACGDISPTIRAGFVCYNHSFDFENIYYRLWASIILLSSEESCELKVKRYLSK